MVCASITTQDDTIYNGPIRRRVLEHKDAIMVEKYAELTAADSFMGPAAQDYICIARIPTKVKAVAHIVDLGREPQCNVSGRSIKIWPGCKVVILLLRDMREGVILQDMLRRSLGSETHSTMC